MLKHIAQEMYEQHKTHHEHEMQGEYDNLLSDCEAALKEKYDKEYYQVKHYQFFKEQKHKAIVQRQKEIQQKYKKAAIRHLISNPPDLDVCAGLWEKAVSDISELRLKKHCHTVTSVN